LVSPKKINRNKKVRARLKAATSKMKGTIHELDEHVVRTDIEMLKSAMSTKIMSDLLVEKIKVKMHLTEPITE